MNLARDRHYHDTQQIGCLACRRRGFYGVPGDQHHPNLGGLAGQKRISDKLTEILCPWHHRGVHEGASAEFYRQKVGPSLALESRKFREEFGTDEELLAEQARLLSECAQQRVGA